VAVASVKFDFITGPAAAAAAKLKVKTEQLAKSVTKLQRINETAWTKFGNKVRKTRRKVQTDMEKLKRAIGGLNIGSLVAGAGLGFFAKNAVQTAGKAQALEVRLKLLTETTEDYEKAQGIAARAAKQFGLSNIEAADGVTNIVGRLKPLGFTLEDIETTFFGFNTAAALAGVTASEASGAFRQLAQALGSGRLAGDEFNSISEQVPTLLAPIADELGVTVGELKKLGSDGKLTSEVLITALKKIQSEGGSAVEEIISKSALQRFKEFQNAMEDLSRAVGDELMPAITPLVKLMTRLVKAASELNPVAKRIAIVLTAIAAGLLIVAPAIVTLVAGMKLLLPTFTAVAVGAGILTAKFWLIAAAVGAVVAAIVHFGNKFLNWRKDQKDWNTLLKEGTEKALQSALAIEKETLARINNGEIMDGNATKVEKRIKQLEEELGLREKLAESLITDKDREDIANELSMDKINAHIIHPDLGGTAPIEKQKKIIELTEKEKQLRLEIKDILAQGMQSAIEGLITGTKTLGQALADVAKSLGSMFLQRGIQGMLGKMPFFAAAAPAAEGAYFSNGIKPFAAGGMVTKPTMGLIGEAGEDEYVIPASKMAQSMQRYSAGARGESVIPGTGQSSAGGGANAQTTVNYSGPILNFNSEEFVPKSAVGQIINSAVSRGAAAGENRTLSTLKNSRSRRSSLGL
jgi:tape measure domain-containing protein